MNNFFEILRGGINTTFQDVGRNNLHHIGIPSSGAMDNRNFQLSNSILGNKLNNPVIEFAYQGPLIRLGSFSFAISNTFNGVLPIMFQPPGLSKV